MRLSTVAATVLAALVLGGCGATVNKMRVSIPFVTCIEQAKAGNVSSVCATGTEIRGTVKRPITRTKTVWFSAHVPTFTSSVALTSLLEKERVTVLARAPSGRGVDVLVEWPWRCGYVMRASASMGASNASDPDG